MLGAQCKVFYLLGEFLSDTCIVKIIIEIGNAKLMVYDGQVIKFLFGLPPQVSTIESASIAGSHSLFNLIHSSFIFQPQVKIL
jgi:hypothetical protein